MRVIALCDDQFGTDVVDRLKPLLSDRFSIITLPSLEPKLVPYDMGASVIYMPISARPIYAYCRKIDDLSFASGAGFLPAVLETSKIYVGPFIRPGSTPCWECWEERFNSQHPFAAERRQLLTHYDAAKYLPTVGFMPYTVTATAAMLALILTGDCPSEARVCSVSVIDIFDHNVTTDYYVGRHLCSKCSVARHYKDRTITSLVDFVQKHA
jgi:bacteriocin biosynthesis cyclodehydratase domain-containing protein